MSLVGQQIGSIRIDRPLGEGGMGEVYLGFDEKLERRVAVKTLRTSQRLDADAKARLVREARLLSKLGHPAICQIYDLIEGEGADYLVLEYVQGRTLRQLMRERPSFERLLDARASSRFCASRTSHSTSPVVFPFATTRASAVIGPLTTGRKKLIFNSSVVIASPSARPLKNATPIAMSARSQYTPPCTVPTGL